MHEKRFVNSANGRDDLHNLQQEHFAWPSPPLQSEMIGDCKTNKEIFNLQKKQIDMYQSCSTSPATPVSLKLNDRAEVPDSLKECIPLTDLASTATTKNSLETHMHKVLSPQLHEERYEIVQNQERDLFQEVHSQKLWISEPYTLSEESAKASNILKTWPQVDKLKTCSKTNKLSSLSKDPEAPKENLTAALICLLSSPENPLNKTEKYHNYNELHLSQNHRTFLPDTKLYTSPEQTFMKDKKIWLSKRKPSYERKCQIQKTLNFSKSWAEASRNHISPRNSNMKLKQTFSNSSRSLQKNTLSGIYDDSDHNAPNPFCQLNSMKTLTSMKCFATTPRSRWSPAASSIPSFAFQSPSSGTVLNRESCVSGNLNANEMLKTLLDCVSKLNVDTSAKENAKAHNLQAFSQSEQNSVNVTKRHAVTFSDIIMQRSPDEEQKHYWEEAETADDSTTSAYSSSGVNLKNDHTSTSCLGEIAMPPLEAIQHTQSAATPGARTAPAAMMTDADEVLANLLDSLRTPSMNTSYINVQEENYASVITGQQQNNHNDVNKIEWINESPSRFNSKLRVPQSYISDNAQAIQHSFTSSHMTSASRSKQAYHNKDERSETFQGILPFLETNEHLSRLRTFDPEKSFSVTSPKLNLFHHNKSSPSNPYSMYAQSVTSWPQLWSNGTQQLPAYETHRKVYADDRDRMVYVSWIPKRARAYNAVDKREMELDLKYRLREYLSFAGLTKVLLFPPKGVHCKLIFNTRNAASAFMEVYGGDNRSAQTEKWKEDLCRIYDINMRDKFDKTVVKIEWSQK